MTELYLAMLSLGASTAAIILAFYLIAKTRQPSFDQKRPEEKVNQPPVMPVVPQESLGLRLKRRLDET